MSPGAGPTDVSVNWRPKVIHPVPLARSAKLVAVGTYASLLDHWSLPRP